MALNGRLMPSGVFVLLLWLVRGGLLTACSPSVRLTRCSLHFCTKQAPKSACFVHFCTKQADIGANTRNLVSHPVVVRVVFKADYKIDASE